MKPIHIWMQLFAVEKGFYDIWEYLEEHGDDLIRVAHGYMSMRELVEASREAQNDRVETAAGGAAD